MAFEKVTYVDNQTVITADQMNAIQDAIIENRNDISSLGDSVGGYYTPMVTQVDDITMEISFVTSKEDMPAVETRQIALPSGPQGEPGFDGQDGAPGYTPIKGTDYWTEEDKAEMVADVLAALPAAEGVAF